MTKKILLPLVFLFAAALARLWLAPRLELLPANYASEVHLTEENQFRDSPAAQWQASTLNVRRVDQTITTTGGTSLINGALHVYYASGEINFETTGIYGVDRRTRQNLPGFGDVDRSGQYLFPPHVRRIGYSIWDPMFSALRQATFERLDQIDGLNVYVFSFGASGMDESVGYSYLPDVPERYLAHTDGQGTLWVEPLSGVVVDYEDSGVSYFVNTSTEARLADFNRWDERYTSETHIAQLKLARTARARILALEYWLPGGLALAALLWMAIGMRSRFRKPKGGGLA